jgi:hypothetical protein
VADPVDPTLTGRDLEIRASWLRLLANPTAGFVESAQEIEVLLAEEVAREGHWPLLAHLRLCGVIPEALEHDSTPEKLYSKYTDAVLAEAFKFLGMRSLVLAGRGDSADVEAFSLEHDFDLVADAKAMRLSRTAKNAKDFKVSSMHRWKFGKRFGVVVAPIFQLPSSSSQIYEQAISYDVTVLSYSHLALLVNYAALAGGDAQDVLHRMLEVTSTAHPSKAASPYWSAINSAMMTADPDGINLLWTVEKRANLETIRHAKDEALAHLAAERARFMKMSHAEAIALLIDLRKIDAREIYIRQVFDNRLLG